jgi:hypothetical protein
MIVIGIKGLIGSGKTTVFAERLIERHGFVRGRWAGALKDMLRAYLRYRGCPAETVERMIDGDLKETDTEWLGGKSPRHAMEGLGGHWGRDWMRPDFWIGTETDRLWIDQPKRVVFEDCRHSNEGDAIENMGGIVAEILRPGSKPKLEHRTEREQAKVRSSWLIINREGQIADTNRQIDSLVEFMVDRHSRMAVA